MTAFGIVLAAMLEASFGTAFKTLGASPGRTYDRGSDSAALLEPASSRTPCAALGGLVTLDYLLRNLGDRLCARLYASLRDSLCESLYDSLDDNLCEGLQDSLGDSFADSLEDSLTLSWEDS
jgi:hypothetical protein